MYDCQQCGACCVDYFATAGYIQLQEHEAKRMQRLSLPVITWHGQILLGTKPYQGRWSSAEATCCVAFVGEVGTDCGCAIHPDRPRACREFEAGTEGCHFARIEAGLPIEESAT
jgi:hypothetical protein